MLAGSALAMDAKPAVVYDKGGKNDGSFNQSAYDGAEKFKAETGIDYRDFDFSWFRVVNGVRGRSEEPKA